MQPAERIGFECPDSNPKRQKIEPESLTKCNRLEGVESMVWHGHKMVRQTNFLDVQEWLERIKK